MVQSRSHYRVIEPNYDRNSCIWLIFFQVEDRTLKRHVPIGVFVVYIDTGSSMPISPSKSRDLADENNEILTEWKWFETTVLHAIGLRTGVIYSRLLTYTKLHTVDYTENNWSPHPLRLALCTLKPIIYVTENKYIF
jgi:hypothetical protein